MKRILFCLTLLFAVIMCRTPTASAQTYGAEYYRTHKSQVGAGNYRVDPLWLFMNEVETAGLDYFVFVPGTAPSSPLEGTLYYDSGSSGLLLYTGSAFVTVDTAGASSLDTAYNTGRPITVDAGTITLTAPNVNDNDVLTIVQSDTTGGTSALVITNAGTGASIEIDGSSTGDDITGTGDTWTISEGGAASFTSVLLGATGIVLQNSETITNATNNKITFDSDTGNVEDFSIGLGANDDKITFSSGSAATTIDLGDMNTLMGMTAITGDAADFTISTTGDSTGEDLIISQAGTGDNQVIIQSAGSANNAIAIQSTKGIDIDSVDDMAITNTASTSDDDFLIQQVGAHDASLLVTSAGTGGDAISLITSSATGDIVINSGDMINIDAADDILIDLAGATGEDILVTNTGGSITLSASEAVADAVVLYASNAAGGIDIDAGTGGIAVDITGAADFKVDSSLGSVYLDGGEAAVDAIKLDASGTAGGVDIDAGTGGITVDSDGVVSIGGADDMDFTLTSGTAGEDMTIAVAGTGDSSILMSSIGTAADAFSLQVTGAAGGIDIDTTNDGAISIVSTDDLTLEVTAGSTGEDIIIQTTGATDNHILIDSEGTSANTIALQSLAGGLDIDAKDDVIITVASSATADDLALVQTGAFNASITLAAAGTGDDAIDLNASAGGIDIDAVLSLALATSEDEDDAIQINASAGGIDITATSGGSGEDIDITATGGSINLIANESAAATIVIATSGGGSSAETIDITNDTGTAASSTTQTDAAIQIEATVGGISLESGLSAADAIRIETDGAAAQITIQAIAGVGASSTGQEDASIQLYSEAGGIALTSGLGGADAIRIESQTALGLITIQNVAGVGASAATEEDASIQLYSQVGGIGLASALNGADAIRIEEGGGTGGTINIHANTGNAVATGAASIQLLSDVGGIGIEATGLASADAVWIDSQAGGINIDAAATYDVTIDSGQILLTASHSVADAILLHATAGAAQEINLLNDEGTNAGAIDLTATLGGIAMAAKDDFIVTLTTTATDDDMTFQTTGSDDTHIEILADGTSENAITIYASAGNIDITGDGATGEDFDIVSTSSALNLSSGEEQANAITLTASTGIGGITIDTGSSGVNFSDDPISNVGDLACADITADANDNIVMSAVKMLVVTISVDESPATDFGFDDTQANKTAQGIRVAVLPANSMINSAFVKCVETLTGSGEMQLTLGTSDEGNQILTSVSADTANDVMGTAAGESPEIAAGTAAINVWISGTPVTNDWDEITAGSWDVCIVYTDYSAALTQTGT